MTLEFGERAVMRIARLKVAGLEFEKLAAECRQYSWRAGRFECRSGSLAVPRVAEALPFRLAFEGGRLDFELQPTPGERWRLSRDADGRVEVDISGGQIGRLRSFVPIPADWKVSGRLEGHFILAGNSLRGNLNLADGRFSDAAGLHAGEKIGLVASIDAQARGPAWTWRAELHWRDGEVYWQPVYAKADGQSVKARGSADADRYSLVESSIELPGIGEIRAAGELSRPEMRWRSGRLESAGIDLGRGGAAFLAPVLAERGLPEVELAGRLAFALGWDGEGMTAASLGLDDVAIREKDGRFSASGVFGGLPWLRSGASQGYLAVGSARAGDFSLGAFRLPITVEPGGIAAARTEIPLLGSELTIENLVWRKSGNGPAWEGDLALALTPIALPELTRAFGLPQMAGTLSASFPHLRYRDGAAYLDGALVIQVFEGFLNCTRLRLEDPFGPAPRLTADVEARHLNLGQLTETFSFGRIEGYADADIRGLEMTGWKPVQFDANVVSSPGNYRKRISQRAVQDISALGGAGAGAAIQASFLRLFEEFGYDRIGLSCRLRNGICEMGGIEEAARGYVMVKGGGIPALTVIGYNREVDWSELVDRLRGIIHNDVRPVIR